ncbi:hypothetical protein N9Z27_00755 [Alphaproteobacteria bacterium]|nr:hypothetical protein [Alphaproteobacteria bacterium]
MAKKTAKQTDLIKKRQKAALDRAIDSSESFLGKLKDYQKRSQKKSSAKRKKVSPTTLGKRKRKKQILWGSGIGFVLLIAFSVHWLSQGQQGTPLYGTCKNFLELRVQYPDYLRLAHAQEARGGIYDHVVKIWYSRLDAYGQRNMERLFCYFDIDENGAVSLVRATINDDLENLSPRKASIREINPEEVARFNQALPGILMIKTDLSYPLNFSDRIRDLQFRPNLFRKPVFGRRR